MGSLPRVQKRTQAIIGQHDLLIVLGADPVRMSVYSEHAPLPPAMPIIQIGLVDADLGKNFPTEIAMRADLRETLRVLTPALQAAGGVALAHSRLAALSALQDINWMAKRRSLVRDIGTRNHHEPIDPDWLALCVVEAMPANGILIDEGLTSSRHIPSLRAHKDRHGYHALASGGIGWALPASVGASLANPGRPVVCFVGDGSAMYSIQALWTAAHHKLPLTIVLANNGGYRIIKQRLVAFHRDQHFVGMDFADPAIDFTALARAMGLEAVRVTAADDLAPVLSSAFEQPGTKLIEIMLDRTVEYTN